MTQLKNVLVIGCCWFNFRIKVCFKNGLISNKETLLSGTEMIKFASHHLQKGLIQIKYQKTKYESLYLYIDVYHVYIEPD